MDIFKIKGDRPAARIQEAFELEAKLRDGRTPAEWQNAELMVVWRATNEERTRLCKGPVSLVDVEKAERQACGHIDYSLKWALECEKLVLADPHPASMLSAVLSPEDIQDLRDCAAIAKPADADEQSVVDAVKAIADRFDPEGRESE